MENNTIQKILNFLRCDILKYSNVVKDEISNYNIRNWFYITKRNARMVWDLKVFSFFVTLFLITTSISWSQTIDVDGNPRTTDTEWTDGNIIHVSDPFGNGVVDNQFTEGSKDFLFAADLRWVIGQTKAKNDIANGAAVLVNSVEFNGTPVTGSGNYLAFAGDRTSNNGDAQIGFWFYQNSTGPATQPDGTLNFAPPHAVGDLLVLADFTGGGRNATVTVYRWVGTGGTAPNTNGTLDIVQVAAAVAQNNSGAATPPTGWTFINAQYDTNEFYEGYVDIGLIAGNGLCYSTFLLETRSSQSITASLDDFVGGALGGTPKVLVDDVTICQGEQATLTATPSPGSPSDFTYIWTGPNSFSATTQSITVSPSETSIYKVKVSKNGCESPETSVTVTVNPKPTIDAKSVCVSKTVDMGTDGTNAWSSSNTAVATINANTGVVTGVSAGTSTITYTNANGCSGTAIVTVYANPTIDAKSVCVGKTVDMGTDGTNAWSSSNTAVATINANTGVVTGVLAGTSTITYTNANGCSGTAIVTVYANPTIDAKSVCVGKTVDMGTDGTNAWSSSNTAVATIDANTGVVTGVLAGTSTIAYTNANGCSGTATVTVNSLPTCGITGEQTICSGGSSTFTATEGMTSYAWTGPNSFIASTQSINVSVAGIYYVTITNGNGCQSTCSRELMVVSCGGPLCTYTQGAYGNSGGKYCDGTEGGIPTIDLITQAITNAGGSITVGKAGVGLSSVTMNSGGENCIITQMPGGGKATEIVPAGDYDICPSLPNNFLKNGKINNVLLSQTIALSLNVNITKPSQLGSFVLQAGTLATAKPEGGCGSSVAKSRVCGHFEDNVWVNTVNEYTYRTFSAAVINAINGDKTIAGLLDLANRALANVDGIKNSEGGASLSDITGAVAAVNEVFDECAIAVGWDIEKCPEPPALDLSSVTTAKISSVETASFTAYPVPFKDQLTIRYDFDYLSDVKIEVFNSKGVIVYSMTDTGSFLGKEVTIIINNTLQQQQVYYVRLTTSQGSTVKSVMSSY